MRKSVLFLTFLMIIGLVLFTGCDGILGGKKEDPTKVSSFEVEDDSAEAMSYTEKSDEALFKIMVSAGVARENDPIILYQVQITASKEYLDYAKITEAQIIALAELAEENADTLKMIVTGLMNDLKNVTAEEINQALAFYKAAIGIIGNDAAGKLAYSMALNQAEGDTEMTASIEAIGYENFVISSRMSFALINSAIWSLDSTDVEAITPIVKGGFDPTYAEIVQLFEIAADALDSISLSEKIWSEYFALIIENYEKVLQMLPQEDIGNETFSAEDIYGVGKEILGFLGQYMSLNLKFASSVFLEVDVELFELMETEHYSQSTYDPVEGEDVVRYYINGELVTEEEYNKLDLKQKSKFMGLFEKAYASLKVTSKTQIQAEVEATLDILNTTIDAQFEEEYVYEGEASTFADVMAQLTIISSFDFDSKTYAEAEAAFDNAKLVFKQYIGTKAAYVHMMLSVE